jgi:23S rRNA (guanosine2251-2'-O)-methyltransferase
MKKFKKPEGRPARRPLHKSSGARAPSKHPGHRAAPPQAQNHPRFSPPQGRCVVGIHAVEELLAVRPQTISAFWIREKYHDHPSLTAIHDQAERLHVKIKTVTPGTLDKIVGNHQGVIAFSEEEPQVDWTTLEKAEQATLVALDEVEDPHNLGAVMRTAWLLGGQAILTTERRSAQLSPAVSKVAQGAVEHIPVVSDMALPQQLEALKAHGFWILGMSHKATQSLFSLEIPEKVVWVLGSESSGLRKSVEGMCDDLISIPQLAPNASYNVSVAAAIALSETFRQRRST